MIQVFKTIVLSIRNMLDIRMMLNLNVKVLIVLALASSSGSLTHCRSRVLQIMYHVFLSTMHVLISITPISLKIDHESEDENIRNRWMFELELIGGDGVMDVINGFSIIPIMDYISVRNAKYVLQLYDSMRGQEVSYTVTIIR